MLLGKTKKLLSLLLVMVMVVTLIPALGNTVHAAAFMEIQNWQIGPNQPVTPSNVTSRIIDLEVEYNSIDDADLPRMYYEIEEVSTGITRTVQDNPAVKIGTQRVRFSNVELREGLNRITVKLDTASQPQSLPAWINFSSVATITDLVVDGQTFRNGIFAPAVNPLPNQNLFISGVAPNATEVRGFTTINPGGVSSNIFFPQSGEFEFFAGESTANLQLRPGDNDLTIVGSNPFRSYRAERTFVYNNGRAFLYDTIAKPSTGSNLGDPDDEMLFRQPTFEADSTANGTYTIDIETSVKINRFEGNLTHSGFEININGNDNVAQVSLSLNQSTNTVTYTVYGGATNTTTDVVVDPNGYYKIGGLVIPNIEIDASRTEQLLEVEFIPAPSFVEERQEFIFYYSNEHEPYVKEVRFADSGSELYSGAEITISLETVDFIVETENSATGVRVYLGGSSTPIATGVLDGSPGTTNLFNVSLDKDRLPEGRSILRFVPYDATGEFPVGAREYLVNYNPSPYVYLTNVANGERFTSAINEPKGRSADGVEFDGPVLQIQPVNIPENQYGDIRVRINDNVDKIQTADRHTYTITDPNNSSQTVTVDEIRFFFGSNSAPTHRQGDSWRLVNGLNNIVFEVYPRNSLGPNGEVLHGAQPITTFRYELFYFTDDLPEVTKLDIESQHLRHNHFVQVEGQDYRYYTQASSVVFETEVINAETVNVTVDQIDDVNSPARTARLRWNPANRVFDVIQDSSDLIGERTTAGGITGNPDNGAGRILTQSIQLEGTGTYIISITAINKSGLISTRMMEVVREPANFIIHYPIVDPETNIGTINANYTRVYMEAEGASEIIYGRGESVRERTEIEINGETREVFAFELKGLRAGNNNIRLTIVRGSTEENAQLTLINANTPTIGAEFKDSISKNRIRAFNNEFTLSFPRGTILQRNDRSAPDQALSPTRDIFVGIADPVDGRVNKTLHPIGREANDSKFSTKTEWNNRYMLLRETTQRFRMVSNMYWVDGGAVPLSGARGDILYGSGIYPYEPGHEFYTKNAGNIGDQFVPSQPGTLTLSYDPNMVDSSWRYITVFHYGYNEDYLGGRYEWKNIGGTINQRNNTITVPFTEFGYYVVMYMDQSFDDVIGHPWARNYLDTLYAKGIMMNKETSRFETNEAITRGEFATLITKAFELPLNYHGRRTFEDVTPQQSQQSFGLYDYKYIETAARAGIVRGTLGNRFQPNSNISREQAATIIARAANLRLESNSDRARTQLDRLYTDVNNMDDYAVAAIYAVSRAGLMDGKPNVLTPGEKETFYFDPRASMTRAEAAAIVMRVLLNAKKIPSL